MEGGERTRLEDMNKVLLLWTLVNVAATPFCWTLDIGDCSRALGMESGAILDKDISASSSYNVESVGPSNARLMKDVNGGAWCPLPQIDAEAREYLEISLPSLHALTQVATQGRFGNGQGQEFTEEYTLQYWRPGAGNWITYRTRTGQEVFEGNKNTYSVANATLDPPMLATKMRILPHSLHVRTVCMRVEIYGCPFKDGVVSYSTPEGDRFSPELDYSDSTYDGFKDDSYLHGGLGQMTDGQRGDDDFRRDVSGLGPGYEWMGWRNDSHPAGVQMLFSFDTVRNFTAFYLHTNNMFSEDVQVFSWAKMWFSVGGKHFGEPIHFTYLADQFSQKSRNVTIFLHHKLGRFLKVQLAFAAKWILISEVSFHSVPAVGNFSEEEPPAAPPIVSRALSEGALSRQHVGLVIGLLAAVVLVLILALFFILARNRRKQDTQQNGLKPLRDTIAADLKVSLEDSGPEKLLYQEPQDCKIPYMGTFNSDSGLASEYAVPDITKTITPSPLLATALGQGPGKPPRFPTTLPKAERFYAASDVVKPLRAPGPLGGNGLYALPDLDLLTRDEGPDREIPRQRIRLIQRHQGDGSSAEAQQTDLMSDPSGGVCDGLFNSGVRAPRLGYGQLPPAPLTPLRQQTQPAPQRGKPRQAVPPLTPPRMPPQV